MSASSFSISLFGFCLFFSQVADGIVHGHCADHGRGHLDQLLAEGVGLAVVGEIHDGLAVEFQRKLYLFEFSGVVSAVTGDSKIDIDLGAQSFADAVGMQALVVDVRRDTDCTLGNTLPNQFRFQMLFFCHGFHFRCQDSLFGSVHLCSISRHMKNPFQSRFQLLHEICRTGRRYFAENPVVDEKRRYIASF